MLVELKQVSKRFPHNGASMEVLKDLDLSQEPALRPQAKPAAAMLFVILAVIGCVAFSSVFAHRPPHNRDDHAAEHEQAAGVVGQR